MAEAQPVSLPGRGVVSQARLRGAGRGRRDRTASRGRAVERGRGSSEVLRAASALGRHVTGLDVAGTREAMIRRLSQPHRHRATLRPAPLFGSLCLIDKAGVLLCPMLLLEHPQTVPSVTSSPRSGARAQSRLRPRATLSVSAASFIAATYSISIGRNYSLGS